MHPACSSPGNAMHLADADVLVVICVHSCVGLIQWSVRGGVTPEVTAQQTSTRWRRLSIKAVSLEMNTKQWDISIGNYIIHRLTAWYSILACSWGLRVVSSDIQKFYVTMHFLSHQPWGRLWRHTPGVYKRHCKYTVQCLKWKIYKVNVEIDFLDLSYTRRECVGFKRKLCT